MDTVRLRTLALKSVIGFGKYADSSVSQILELNDTTYLRYLYYHVEGISFLPEILNFINISKEYEIEKPGKNIELHEKLKIMLQQKKDNWQKDHPRSKHFREITFTKRKKMDFQVKIRRDRFTHRKCVLQSINQGH